MFPFLLLNNVYKFFIGPYINHPNECNQILMRIVSVIVFVWLLWLSSSYAKAFNDCPDNKYLEIANKDIIPINKFPLIFSISAIIFYIIFYNM